MLFIRLRLKCRLHVQYMQYHTLRTESQLSADDRCVSVVPLIVTDRPPASPNAHLNTSLELTGASD